MNCLEFRRTTLSDPQRPGAEARAHAANCPACSELLARLLQDEARLARALRVPVPDDLHLRILGRVRAGRARWLALAASVLIASAIALVTVMPRPDPVALAGIDFVVFEEAQSIVDAKPTDLKALAGVARRMGVSLPAQLGEIRYICDYPFAGGSAPHLLIKTALGKVTVLLLPGKHLASRAAASARGLEAAVVPASAGSIAIVGDSRRSIRRVEMLLTSG